MQRKQASGEDIKKRIIQSWNAFNKLNIILEKKSLKAETGSGTLLSSLTACEECTKSWVP